MKLVKKIRLVFREGKSDKVYEVDLVEQSGFDAARYSVNFRYGRRGRSLTEGTKTARPLTLAEAEAVYQSIVVSKTNSGYWDESGPAPVRTAAPAPVTNESTESVQAARTAALLKALGGESDSKKRGRIIWNLGQGEPIENAAATLRTGRGDWLEDYSIAWTLGRWRDAAHTSVLDKLCKHGNDKVREIALEALLLTMTPSAIATRVRAESPELTPTLRAALEASRETDILRELETLQSESSASLNRSLVLCYRFALVDPAVQRALLAFMASCKLAPGAFKGVRHVFKVAEMRVDYDMFACLAHRFDTTPQFFLHTWNHIYLQGHGSVNVAKELARDNPRLAYSQRTRAYLRRRAWRTLQRLGRADSEHYVAMATAVLLRVTDAQAEKPRSTEIYRWDREQGRSRSVGTRAYDEFAALVVFNHILRGANPEYRLNASGKAWARTSQPGADGARNDGARSERFAHLWDRTPAAAVDLLKLSRCSVVHDAAIRMLAGQTAFLASLSAGEVAQLLASPYPQTTQFVLPLAEALFARGAGDEHLMLALLRSPLERAREVGMALLRAQDNWVANQPLVIELLLTFSQPLLELVDGALGTASLSDTEQQQIVAGVITQLLARELPLDVPAAENLARTIVRRLPAAVAALPLPLLDRLLAHADAGKQLLGARLLNATSIEFTEIPQRMLQHIQGSAHEEVRAMAIALLNKQGPAELLQQMDMLAELFHRGSAVERRELLTIFGSLASSGAENEARVLRALSALLFRAEQEQGQGDELVGFFLQRGASAAGHFSKETIWRLLQAQSVVAQRVGAALLQHRPAREFSVRQWARLAQHSDLSARRYAMAAYQAHESTIKQHTRDALRMLDGPWEDAREFGFRYFREHYGDADWSPEFIIGVCDSTRDEVQTFGRELLQRFFQQEQGSQYLAALSEHPALNVQLFVSNFLESHAAGQRERILALRGYFVTTLSQINRARVCKDRVLEFLLREALKDAPVAEMVVEVFTRVSLTVVHRDRSQLIKALIALRAAHPDLAVPIKLLPVRVSAAPVRVEVRGGV